MAQEITAYIKCQMCGGTHEFLTSTGIDGQIVPCPYCPDGFIEFSKITFDPGHDDIMDKCNDIITKCNDILEALP